MSREAFARARRFLSYNRSASTGAILAAVGQGIVSVGLIALLGLFTDLVVHRGQIDGASGEVGERQLAAFGDRLAEISGHPEEARLPLRRYDLGLVALAWRSHRGDHWYEPLFTYPAAWFEWTRSNSSYLIGLLALALVLAMVQALLDFAMHVAAAKTTLEASTRLRRAVYHQTYRLGTLAFRALGPAEAVGLFARNVEAIHDGLYGWLTTAFREPTRFVLLLALALAIDPWLSLAFLLFALLVWLLGGQLAAHFRRKGKALFRRSADQMALLQECITMMRLVKCYLMELFNQSRVERQLADYARSVRHRYRGQAIYRPMLTFLGLLAGCVLLFAAGWGILAEATSVAGVITLSAALLSLYGPVKQWIELRGALRRARLAAVKLFEFLDRRGDVGQVVGAKFLQPLSKLLEFDHVSLKEPGTGRSLLQGVTLQIGAGQRVALVGQDEMEKHALVYLIPRFLDPNEGEIRIDGNNLRWVTLDGLRAQVALVLQHNLVFNDTVRDNIGCGDPSFSLPQIMEAAKMAHAHHFISHLPDGYETRIGELGHTLSTGEQFRIALARAILRDPAIVIIEEPATPLDDDNKAMLDDTFSRFLPGRTTLFLPHRIATLRSCDRVFLLHKGKVEATGGHRELLSQNDLYRHLQYMEFNVYAEQT